MVVTPYRTPKVLPWSSMRLMANCANSSKSLVASRHITRDRQVRPLTSAYASEFECPLSGGLVPQNGFLDGLKWTGDSEYVIVVIEME